MKGTFEKEYTKIYSTALFAVKHWFWVEARNGAHDSHRFKVTV